MNVKSIIIIFASVFLLYACKVTYSFSGADIDGNIKTFSVEYFENSSGNGPANLGVLFTQALKDKLEQQTNLKLVQQGGDIVFSGQINQYYYSIQSPSGNNTSNLRRITMQVQVNYKNTIIEEDSWETNFQNYAEHDVNLNLNTVEEESIRTINTLTTEEIFNKAFVKW